MMIARKHKLNFSHILSGVSLIFFFIFTEAIPLGGNMAELPRLFSIQFFIPTLLDPYSVYFLLLPSALLLLIAIQPLRARPPLLEHCLLITIGFAFYPLVFLLREYVQHPYTNEGSDALLWALLLPGWIGLVLWSRSGDFLWSSAAAATLWDMGAAIRGVMMGVERIGVPYHQGLPPTVVVTIDGILFLVCLLLWRIAGNPIPAFEKFWKRYTRRPPESWLKGP